MGRLMNYLRGMAQVRAEGPFPERLINLCAQEGVEFWGVEWLDGHTFTMLTRRRTLDRLEELAERGGCTVALESRRGLPDFLGRFRTRYAFLAGLAIALCAVGVLSRFVLVIAVTGNQKVPTAVILNQLRQLGVRPGVYGPSLDRRQLAQEALLGLEELSWMGINLYGTRLEVIVREPVDSPERLEEGGYFDVAARGGGMILRVEAEQGEAQVQEGDTVVEGDILISGVVSIQPPKYSDLPVRCYQTHARGRVWARTWRTLTASIPLEAQVKELTGAEKNRWSLIFFGKRIEIFGNSSISWPFYDKITTVHQAALPGGQALPLSLSRERLREYKTRAVPVDEGAAQALLEEELLKQLAGLIGEEGEVESTRFDAQVEGGALQVTLTAECREEIGREQPGVQQLPQPPEEPGSGN